MHIHTQFLPTNLWTSVHKFKIASFLLQNNPICTQLYTLCPEVWTIVHKFKITNFLLQNNPICTQLYTLCPEVWTIVHKFKITNCLQYINVLTVHKLYTNLKSLTFFFRTILFVHNYTHFAQKCGQLYTNLKSLNVYSI